jgi:hypothetical protein
MPSSVGRFVNASRDNDKLLSKRDLGDSLERARGREENTVQNQITTKKRGRGRPITSPSTIVKNAMSELSSNATRLQKADTLLASGFNVLDLNKNAALLHVIIDDFAESRATDELQLLFAATENLRKTAESVERIRASKAFTDSEYQATINLVVNIIELMPEELQHAAIEMLSATSVRDLQNVTPIDED